LEIPGTVKPTTYVVGGAHADDRMAVLRDTTSQAPGADDNASGVSALLELVRVIGVTKQRFQYTLRIITFCGEEQGLYGSKAQAATWKGDNIIAMFNADMLGWTVNNAITVTFDNDLVTPALTTSSKNIVSQYLPSVKVGTATGCCSDQQPFYEAGWPTASFFETPTNTVVYPYYHKATDTSNYLNYQQVYYVTQSLLACIGEYAIPA